MAGTKVLQGVETALTTRRRPVKVGLVVDLDHVNLVLGLLTIANDKAFLSIVVVDTEVFA